MEKNIFDFNSYITYLNFHLARPGQRGARTKLGNFIQVQPTYISQILKQKAHLSMEQAERASQFLQHIPQETHYFLLLVQKERAATNSLKTYFQNQLDKINQSRMVLVDRLEKVDTISPEERSWYYSSWLHSAIHMATTILKLQKPSDIAKAFSLSEEKALEILAKLEVLGLLQKTGINYVAGIRRIRLGRDNNEIIKHHTNWRLQAIQSLEHETIKDMHYSAVVTLSEADALFIKNLFLETIKNAQSIIKDSAEERLCSINIDFFSLLKSG